jgi:hypothetical protein
VGGAGEAVGAASSCQLERATGNGKPRHSTSDTRHPTPDTRCPMPDRSSPSIPMGGEQGNPHPPLPSPSHSNGRGLGGGQRPVLAPPPGLREGVGGRATIPEHAPPAPSGATKPGLAPNRCSQVPGFESLPRSGRFARASPGSRERLSQFPRAETVSSCPSLHDRRHTVLTPSCPAPAGRRRERPPRRSTRPPASTCS